MGLEKLHTIFDDIRRVTKGSYTSSREYTLIAIALLQFCLIINSSWRAVPDGALYLELGESMVQGRGYIFNGEPHTYVPPGYPALIAITNIILGRDFLSYRVVMAFIGFLTGALGYLLVLRLCGKDAALLIGGAFWLSHVLLDNSTFTCSDVFFALFVFAAIHSMLGVEIGGIWRTLVVLIGCGLVAGLPSLIRVNGWGIPPALAIYLFSITRGHPTRIRIFTVAVFLATALLPSALWEIYKSSFPQSANEGTYLQAVTGRDLSTQVSIIILSLKDYLQETSFALTGVSLRTGFIEFLVPTCIAVGMARLLIKGDCLLMPLTIIQILGLSLSPAGSRYLIAVMPALYLSFVEGLIFLLTLVQMRYPKLKGRPETARSIVRGCIMILICLNLAGNAVTIFQARTPVEKSGAESARDVPFFLASRWLKEHGPGAAVMTMHPRVIHYLSGLPTIELVRSGVPESQTWVHNQDEISRLVQEGKPRYFFSDEKNVFLERHLRQTLEDQGFKLRRIPELNEMSRFALWEIKYP